ncbi:MAG: DUF4340 domain-containing protein [Xanthomonadales bacterium]|nr:DUF4340 domain-containing protein [Gammaproteobacteria bacterium]MBT8054918.1 DUF4340 domain-containing protein [Gammaproteobacteria bacterium]NND57304.1 DUF4340 domain-containing protein [Xanthomonadales bacterium]NNK51038.1 DUF4340 domain-containing protein [Xanthomonadales bacterium]
MSRKHFSWLLFITFLVAALVLMLPGKTGRESSLEQSDFLPQLAARANEVEWLRLTGAGDAVIATLTRDGNAWVVEEGAGYRADWGQLKSVLAGLANARIVEVKTDNPDYYTRLGVEDVSAAEAAGVMLEFAEGSGIPAVIVGNDANARAGQYVRLRDSAASVLIDSRVNLPKTTSGWLDKDIIDISDAEVVEYTIEHPDGVIVEATKASADDEDFELQEIPEGREIRSAWTVNAPANSLAALTLEAVLPAADLNWDEPVQFRLLTADGLTIDSELVTVQTKDEDSSGEEHWLKLRAGVFTTAVENAYSAAAKDDSETRFRAGEINRRVDGWAYRVPRYKYDSIARKMEDMLQPAGDN